MALSEARKERKATRPRMGSVLDAVRLLCRNLCAALEGAYLLEGRAATRSFSRLAPGGGPRLRRGTDRGQQSRLGHQHPVDNADRAIGHPGREARRAVT